MTWKPIKTVPKNAQRAILYGRLLTYCISKDRQGQPFGPAVVAEAYRRYGKWWVGLYECLPTHWMNLPEPPDVSTKGACAMKTK